MATPTGRWDIVTVLTGRPSRDCRLRAGFSQGCLNERVERAQELRTILPGEGRRPAPGNAELAQMARHLAAGQRVADVVAVPDLAGRGDGARSLGQATRCQRNIRRHADIGRRDPLGDPVIGRIRLVSHHDHANIVLAGRPDRTRTVGDDEDLQRQAAGHAIDLLADRAGIAIDIDIAHQHRHI